MSSACPRLSFRRAPRVVPPPGSCLIAVDFSELRVNSPGLSQQRHVSSPLAGHGKLEEAISASFTGSICGDSGWRGALLTCHPNVHCPTLTFSCKDLLGLTESQTVGAGRMFEGTSCLTAWVTLLWHLPAWIRKLGIYLSVSLVTLDTIYPVCVRAGCLCQRRGPSPQ